MDNDHWIRIIRVRNGFVLESPNEDDSSDIYKTVIEEKEDDELSAGQELLWDIMDCFGLGGSRHDAQRLTITREKGDKYEG